MEPIYLRALKDGWGPRHAIHNPATGEVVRWRNGSWTQGTVFPAVGKYRTMAEDFRCPSWCMFADPDRQAEAEARELKDVAKAKRGNEPAPRPRTGRRARPHVMQDLPGAGPVVPGGAGAFSGSTPGDQVGIGPSVGGPFAEEQQPSSPTDGIPVTRRASDVKLGSG